MVLHSGEFDYFEVSFNFIRLPTKEDLAAALDDRIQEVQQWVALPKHDHIKSLDTLRSAAMEITESGYNAVNKFISLTYRNQDIPIFVWGNKGCDGKGYNGPPAAFNFSLEKVFG